MPYYKLQHVATDKTFTVSTSALSIQDFKDDFDIRTESYMTNNNKILPIEVARGCLIEYAPEQPLGEEV